MARWKLTRIVAAFIMTQTLVCFLAACSQNEGNLERQVLTIDGQTFHLELALEAKAWEQGLSDRRSIDPDDGMLFVFNTSNRRYFVMRRCYFPIDLIYLDANGYVVQTHQMTVEPNPMAPDNQLKKYDSRDPVQFAIELPGGSLDRLKLGIADRIDLPYDRLKQMAAAAN